GREGVRRLHPGPPDAQAEVRVAAARARGHRILPPPDARRLGPQHARRELPVALLERDLRRQPRAGGSLRLLLQPDAAGRILRARRRRRGRVDGRRAPRLHRQQLCNAPHRGNRRTDAVQASRADAVPAEESALPYGDERGRRVMSEELRSAVAAGVLGAERDFRELLQSIVEVARAIFRAKASSIFLLDEPSDELVFEAVAGEGSDSLVGRRFPSSTGIAGFVLVSRQPLVIEDVIEDPRFSRETAESTGFVPKGLMAVPLLHEERA